MTQRPPYDRPRVAVIPVAGRGTRWLPVTRNIPKELLPVWRRTSASYAFEEAVRAGFEEVIFVTSPGKHEVVEHFEHFDATDLGPRYANEEYGHLRDRIKIAACEQTYPRGLGDAILCAEEAVAGRNFAVLLPDEVLMDNGVSRLLAHTPSVLLMEVGSESISNYGVVDIGQDGLIRGLVEKPSPGMAPSSLAVTGRYTFTPEIFDCLRKTKPGLKGELQLTDAMHMYTKSYPIKGEIYSGVRYDVGQPPGLLLASLDFALHDPELGRSIRLDVLRLIGEISGL